jgi:hypothetical protein
LVFVDDQLLVAVLADHERIASPLLTEIVGSGLYTTGVWYWRLARAAVQSAPGRSAGLVHGLLDQGVELVGAERLPPGDSAGPGLRR